MATYYVTKYALANKGKCEVLHSDDEPDEDGYVRLKHEHDVWGRYYRIGRDVFTSEDEAKLAVMAARDRKIARLKKQIAKLEGVA